MNQIKQNWNQPIKSFYVKIKTKVILFMKKNILHPKISYIIVCKIFECSTPKADKVIIVEIESYEPTIKYINVNYFLRECCKILFSIGNIVLDLNFDNIRDLSARQ